MSINNSHKNLHGYREMKHRSNSSGDSFLCGRIFKKAVKNTPNEINSGGNWPPLNLVMVPGNEMDVQHAQRWRNRDVALFDGFCPFGGQRYCGKTRFVFDCVGAAHREDLHRAGEGIFTSIVSRLDQCSNRGFSPGYRGCVDDFFFP